MRCVKARISTSHTPAVCPQTRIMNRDMGAQTTDFLVIGGGVVGLHLALEARRLHPQAKILVIEKEPSCGLHASGRNSGVIHAGFYYSSDSLKARLTRAGNIALKEYCQAHDIPVLECGKAVVAGTEEDLRTFDVLMDRAQKNGVPLEEITDLELKAIEPKAQTLGRALWSPSTAAVDPERVMAALAEDARQLGIEVLLGTRFVDLVDGVVVTDRGRISAGYVLNAAGLYADEIAGKFGIRSDLTILPFKGVYLEAPAESFSLNTHIYPVPDLKYPFLGVHFTVSAKGKVKIGPTAIPAFWREQYSGLDNFSSSEMGMILKQYLRFSLTPGTGAGALVRKEFPKYLKSQLVKRAASLVSANPAVGSWKWGRAGIRAQLFDKKKKALVMDFCLRKDERSMHVLNAVSPAFTCAQPFAKYVFEQIQAAD